MRQILATLIVLVFLCHDTFSQKAEKPRKVKVCNAIVRVSTQEHKIVGVLARADDSTLHLKIAGGSLRINARAIKSITIKRKGNVGNGAMIGAATGAVLGGFIGYSEGDDEPCTGWLCSTYSAEEKAMVGAVFGAGVGALLGMAIASARKEFILIDGNLGVFKARGELLRKYALPQDYVGW